MKESFCYKRIIITPIGSMIAIADNCSLTNLDFIDEDIEVENSDFSLLMQLEIELNEYFAKKRKNFTIPLSPDGTSFQKAVWETLSAIPYASKISYAAEAEIFGNSKAVRAVANANGKNPISILIPCHRVISSNGTIGGYSGGLWRKEFLLSLEEETLR